MTSPRIVLKCDPVWTASPESARDATAHGYMDERHDALAAACYRQAIEEYGSHYEYEVTDGKHAMNWIEQRAAELLAEKLR